MNGWVVAVKSTCPHRIFLPLYDMASTFELRVYALQNLGPCEGGLQILVWTTVAGFERKSRVTFSFCNFFCPLAVFFLFFFFSFFEGGLQIYSISCFSGISIGYIPTSWHII